MFCRVLVRAICWATLVSCVTTSSWARAQDETNPGDTNEADAKLAETTLAETTPAKEDKATSAVDESAAREAFEAVFAEWKTLLEQMRLTRIQAMKAEKSELAGLQDEFDKQIVAGETLIPKLRDSAIAAYNAAPNTDEQIVRWLATIGGDYTERDRFREAKPALDALVKGEVSDPSVYNNAGIVAFVMNEFDRAEELLQKAEDNGALSELSMEFKYNTKDYKEFWEREKQLREEAANATGQDQLPRVRIKTSQGEMVAELFENEAPETVGNFIHLVENGFYDGRSFHRVIGNFMVQGGCPRGDGSGGPGYKIYCECVNDNHRKHFAGTLSMAHAGRDTGGSQFFITHVPTPFLNGEHTAFGRIIEGFDVLAKIKRRDPQEPKDLAKIPDKIESIEVLFKRDHKYQPKKVRKTD